MKPQELKRREGEDRNEEWRTLSREEQLHDLDNRLGKGVGATRQRQKLAQPVPTQKKSAGKKSKRVKE